jgi:hypothetical protein
MAPVVMQACGGGSTSQGAGEPVAETNRGTTAACDAGDADACGLLGTSLYLEARANESSLEPALGQFQKACDGKDWYGCAMAAAMKAALEKDARPAAARAFAMAVSACREGEDAACIYVGDWASKAGDKATAAVHYRTACEMNLEACGSQAMEEYSCRKAVESGAAPHELTAKTTQGDPHPEFKRVRGERDIQPPMGEARGMCKLRLAQVTAQLVLCVSESGVPNKIVFAQFSGAPRWDQRLFETMRTWRYSPFVGKSGNPEPVCTGVTFHYRPDC